MADAWAGLQPVDRIRTLLLATLLALATLAEAAKAWVAGAESGSIRNRSGDVYNSSAVRGYDD